MTHVLELKKLFEEDILSLIELLSPKGLLKPSHVRIVASAILRRWLLDGKLIELANLSNYIATIPDFDTEHLFSKIGAENSIIFFGVGGVNMNGTPIQGMYYSSDDYNGELIIDASNLELKHLSPKKFLQSKRIYFKGSVFNAEQIIRFVSNKLGGVHYDLTREQDWQKKLELASIYFSVGNPDNEVNIQVKDLAEGEGCMVILPSERGIIWSSVDIELLSIAQMLSNISFNDQKFIAK